MKLYRERCDYDQGKPFRWTGRRSSWFHWHIGPWHVGIAR